jgi:benzodiazapine receptor
VTETPNDAAPLTRPEGARRWVGLALFLVVAAGAGFVGNLLQGDDVGMRYLSFERPAWAPPQEAFGIVWPVLYGMIGFAAWKVWDVAGGLRPARVALSLWAAQLVINAVWPGVFFGLNEFGVAIPVIVALALTVVATMRAFYRHDAVAAGLLGPYLLWILYATALNVAIWQLN